MHLMATTLFGTSTSEHVGAKTERLPRNKADGATFSKTFYTPLRHLVSLLGEINFYLFEEFRVKLRENRNNMKQRKTLMLAGNRHLKISWVFISIPVSTMFYKI